MKYKNHNRFRSIVVKHIIFATKNIKDNGCIISIKGFVILCNNKIDNMSKE